MYRNRFILILFIVAAGLFMGACSVVAESPVISSFQECVDAGNKVLRSYPARCVTGDGKVFTEQVGDVQLLKPQQVEGKKLCVDQCGNGQCEMMVCMAEGCPCPENADRCPKDCH